jgi:hypothetical protein
MYAQTNVGLLCCVGSGSNVAKSGGEKTFQQSESTVAYRIVLYKVAWQYRFAVAAVKRR